MESTEAFKPIRADEMFASSAKSLDGTIVFPIPAGAPEPAFRHPSYGTANHYWAYKSRDGEPLGYVCRFDGKHGKAVLPYTLWQSANGDLKWRWAQWPPLRPLYGLDQLSSRPSAPVLVVEGEKCADAAAEAFTSFVVVTSSGGSNASGKSDWSPLAGRDVVIWPDADHAGEKYASSVATEIEAIAATTKIVKPELLAADSMAESPEGYDVADALLEGWQPKTLRERLLDTAEPWAGNQTGSPELAARVGQVTTDTDLATALIELSSLKRGDYSLRRKAEAKRLGLGVAELDSLVRQVKAEDEPRAAELTQRDALVELALEAELWRDDSNEAYATVTEDDARKTFRVRSADFRGWLTRRWMDGEDTGLGMTPGGHGLQDAVHAIEAKALQGALNSVFVRIGHQDGCVYVDLGDESWRAIEIDREGWTVVSNPPVRFIRPAGLLALPEPLSDDRGIRDLHALISGDPSDADAKDARILVLSFLLGVFMPEGSMPLLALSGRQGSGKSTLTRNLRQLVDPNRAPARQQPRSEDDLIIAARNGALIAFDNLSRIDGTLSDALCRIATGAGFSKRRLYSDADEIIMQVRRPVIINGIADLVRLPDLADRSIFVDLPARKTHRPETEMRKLFQTNHPRMLGALCHAVSAALRGYQQEESSPGIRMVDFERWVRAAAPALGFDPDAVSESLVRNRTAGDLALIDDDVVASLIVGILRNGESLCGTATDLLEVFEDELDASDRRHLPKGARALSAHLKRFVPAFERIGIEAYQSREGSDRQRVWRIRRTAS